MKNWIKNTSYPVLLLLIIIAMNLFGIIKESSFLLLNGYPIHIFPGLLTILHPFVLLAILILSEKEKIKSLRWPIGIACLIFGISNLWDVVNITKIFIANPQFFDDFYQFMINSPFSDFLVVFLQSVMLLIIGVNTLRDKKMPKSFTVIFGLGAFLILYLGIMFAFGNPLNMINSFESFMYIMALWYIPRIYDEQKNNTVKITKGKIKLLVWLFVAMFALYAIAMVLSGSSGSSDRGYWGSDGYYHPTESEAEAARRRANEWMIENW